MVIPTEERRRYKRFVVEGGSLFSSRNSFIAYGRVVDISRGGVRCVSLSIPAVYVEYVDEFELYIPCFGVNVGNLCGRMIQCLSSRANIVQGRAIDCFEFRLECDPVCLPRIPDFETIIEERKAYKSH